MTGRPLLLDLFCGAGGAARGYARAGFFVVGVDVEPQPNYPYTFHQMDALFVLRSHRALGDFAAIHASPPCQANLKGLAAVNRGLGRPYDHVDLLAETRAELQRIGIPYVIEQPEQGAAMVDPIRLCGSSFGLPVRRHRLFESNVPLAGVKCEHGRFTEKKYWTGWVKNGERQKATVVQAYGHGGDRHEWGPALDIDWMTYDELAQAIPPAYTEFIGRQLLAHLEQRRVASCRKDSRTKMFRRSTRVLAIAIPRNRSGPSAHAGAHSNSAPVVAVGAARVGGFT